MVDSYFGQKNKTRSEQVAELESAMAQYERRRRLPPEVNDHMIKSVSEQRRMALEMEASKGFYREAGSQPQFLSGRYDLNNGNFIPEGFSSGSNNQPDFSVKTQAGIVDGKRFVKNAHGSSSFGVMGSGANIGTAWRGPNDSVAQVPEVYSPLWLNSNLNLPRDRMTINTWSRAFFALNPIVQNAISLHSTYPISKLNIKSKNRRVEKFFADMIEEIDLMNICVQIAQEYWTLGEAFVYAELDENTAKWKRLLIQNPDNISVERSVHAGEPIISLRPDENLKRIVMSSRPEDIAQRSQLDPAILQYVKKNQNIPLNNFYVSHLARKISPYEVRGTGLIVSCFRALMLMDKLRESKYAQADNMVNPLTLVKIGNSEFRPTPVDLDAWKNVFECYDDKTEVLTSDGFKLFKDVIDYVEVDNKIISKPKDNIRIGCFNPENEQLEYYAPQSSYVNNYKGDMYHFHNKKIDIKVTPDHDMWVSEKVYNYNPKRFSWAPFKKKKAKDLNINDYNKFRSIVNWEGNSVDSIYIGDKNVPINVYLEFMGYVLSEGCCYSDGKSQNTVSISQKKYTEKMKLCIDNFSKYLGKSFGSHTTQDGLWNGVLCDKNCYDHFVNNIGLNGSTYSYEKHVPSWILNLNKNLLNVLLESLLYGDGSRKQNANGTYHNTYWTTSKQLADNVQEMAFKCGYSVNIGEKIDRRINRRKIYYVQWSTSANGSYPLVYKKTRNSQTKEWKSSFDIEKYSGKIWCFTVPTGLFITRRNGKITIQGNSAQNDKDFKIFTHDAVNVERVGYAQGIYDISGDIQQAIKEIYIGLMVPSVLMDGTDTTYANGSVALDVLRQRYMQFRNMLASWLKRKIFAPISKLNGFYEYVEGEKTLIVPEIDWNHMSLFDANDYINNMMTLVQDKSPDQPGTNKVSVQTLYRSIGLEYEDELRKMRYEDIQNTIRDKERESLSRYSLSALRALTPDDEIAEAVDSPLLGESPFATNNSGEEDEQLPGMKPRGGGGGMPKPPGPGGNGIRPGGQPRPPMGAGGGSPKGPGGGSPPAGLPPPPV